MGCTTVYAVAELLFALGSPVREAVAVLLSVVALAGVVALIVIVAVVPIAIGEVMEQLTAAVPVHDQPEEATTETFVRPAGRVSVSTLALTGAAAWPRF